MRFERITSESFVFDAVKEIYESSFPPEEKRELNKDLFDRKNYSLLTAIEDEPVGFISVWDFGNFVFIEHFAVKKQLRDQGIGTRMLSKFLDDHPDVILEIERPKTEEQYMRIKFYKQIGFHLNNYQYVQPPYGPEKPPVNMFIMSYPKALSDNEFSNIKKRIYSTVYGIVSK
ncbi:MAG: GNAT family N-acetyltransferase [Candidatus Micrarchaeota archaeon]